MNNTMKIPICKPTLPNYSKYCQGIKKLWNTKMISNFSNNLIQMENIVSKYLKTNHVVGVANGDMGLIIALSLLGLSEGSKVIIPSFTFNSTATAVIWNKLKPVFADIDENTFCVNPVDVSKKITKKTKAILVTHIFGNPCDIKGLRKIAKQAGIYLIFDAAHAYGSKYKGKKIGTLADIEVFSFSGTKVVTSAEGGMIVSKTKDSADKARCIRNYGFVDNYQSQALGLNGKISEFNAVLGCLTLPNIDKYVNKRNKMAIMYKKKLRNVGDIRFQFIEKGNVSTYKDFCILTTKRDSLSLYLAKKGIQTKKYFSPIHKMPYFYKEGVDLPITNSVSGQSLCLPMYNEMSKKELNYVCEAVLNYYNKNNIR